MNRFTFLTTLFTGLFFISSQAQSDNTSAFILNGYNNFTSYSIEEGLPQSNVYSIIQDSKGYLWIGTDGGGVSKFDGNTFKTYNKKTGLSGNVIRALLEDSKGRIWIGTDEGITVYDGIKFLNINQDDSLSGSTILAFVEDNHQQIWAATDDGGVNVIQLEDTLPAIESYTEKEGLSSNAIFDVYEDKNNRIWLASMYGGINIIEFEASSENNDPKITILEEGTDIPSSVILSIEADSEGDLWFGTYGNGAFKIDISKGSGNWIVTPISELNSLTVWDIHCLRNGEIWFGTLGSGIVRLIHHPENRDSNNFLHYTLEQGLPDNQILKVFEDKEMNIWLGTNGHGLCKYIGDHFTHYSKKEKMASNMVQAIEPDKKGNYWIASDGGGLTKLSFDKGLPVFNNYSTEDGLSSNFTSDIAVGKARNPNIWIATTNQGICKFNPNSRKESRFTTLSEDDGLINNRINSILVDDNGIVWCGAANGISRYDGTKFLNVSMEKMIMSDEGVKTIMEDHIGNIWFGTAGGLAKYSGDGSLTTYDEVEGLLDKDVNALVEGPEMNIWIGTNGGGLYKFDTHTDDSIPIQFVMDDSILSSNSINSLQFQDDITLIIGTDNGFDKVTFDSSNKVKNIRNYARSDGFIGIECNDNAITKDMFGRIWFGTVKGLTCYDPTLEKPLVEPPKIHITSLLLFYRTVNWQTKTGKILPWFNIPVSLSLPYTENDLTFNYTGISLRNPEKVKYKYYLEGRDKGWAPLTTERKRDMSGLTPGKYTFHIIAVNANNIESDEPVTFDFTIRPPWYQTTWFYILCIVVIVASIVVYIKWRERKLQKEKKILEDKVEERTREVVRQKNEIQEQKEEIEEKNKDIMDSINYAKTIQEAILPKDEDMEESLKDSFVLFKPKDVVSGDFYWMGEKDNHVLFTAADCTGHGVPGAFMSMIGSALLTEVVIDKGKVQPHDVLNGVRDGIIKALKQTGAEGERKDGMDAALCMVNKNDNILSYAGAQNPLYLIRKNNTPIKTSGGEEIEANLEENGFTLFEVKADKQPVAYYTADKPPFTKHDIPLEKGDTYYIFSDGFPDQFGGPKGKKYMYKRFKKFLLNLQDKSMSEQKNILDKEIEDWKAYKDPEGGEYEQVDDILIIGVKY